MLIFSFTCNFFLFIITLLFSDHLSGYESSRLLGSAPEEIITYLKTANVTFNHHRQCVSTDVSRILKIFWFCFGKGLKRTTLGI